MAGQHSPQLQSDCCDDDGRYPRRKGNLWSCVAHIITAVIGSGVLSLAWSIAQLGWIGGPVCLLFFAIITYISVILLSDCYRSPDPVKGARNYSYMDAVGVNLGEMRTWLCGFFQYLYMYGIGVAYVITVAASMRSIQTANCYHREGHNAACRHENVVTYMLIFGAVQVVASMIPNFHSMDWLSVFAAIMSIVYSLIGFGLGFGKALENGRLKGSASGIQVDTPAKKVWLIFEAFGNIAYAYPYSLLLLEIQDTLKSPPAENNTMKKASVIAISLTTFFYYCCACSGYAAFGDNTPGNILTGFYEPYWLIDIANACVILHLVGGYQVYSQPVFAFVESSFAKFSKCDSVTSIKLPLLPPLELNLFRLFSRTAYVASTTAVAILFPYFNHILGVLGALNFWPLAIYFPVEMYFVQKNIEAWTRKWIVLRAFSFFCLLISIVGLIGSVEGLISAKLKG